MIGTDIKFYGSGASNLGGAIGSLLTSNVLHNLFDIVTTAQAVSGLTEYRCIYVKNTHGTDTLYAAKIWIESQTPSADTSIQIALGASAVSGTETAIADEEDAPGVTFSAPSDVDTSLAIGDLAASAHKAIWIKRVVNVNAVSASNDPFTIKVEGSAT